MKSKLTKAEKGEIIEQPRVRVVPRKKGKLVTEIEKERTRKINKLIKFLCQN
jgi:hypothetical protein